MNIYDRLRKERERLGLNQADFGALGGVKKLAQFNYEKGERHPDSVYLSAIAAAGADVLYILTGQRAPPSPPASSSPPARAAASASDVCAAEAQLLRDYRTTDDQGRALIRATASTAARAARADKAASDDPDHSTPPKRARGRPRKSG